MEERINPVRITDCDTGNVYELDFSRESVRFAEQRGFKLEEVNDFPVTKFSELFYFALRKNHKSLSKEKADKLYEKLGGMTEKLLIRLIQLYQQAAVSNNLQDEEELEKNEHVTVEL